jgi:multiple sugar transport system substrate-binding protein
MNSNTHSPKQLSRRTFLAVAGTALGSAVLAACVPTQQAQPSGQTASQAEAEVKEQPAGGPETVELRAHMVQKQDVSDWIEIGLNTDIDGFVEKNPHISVSLETVPGWTAEYIPKILSFAAAGTLGDLVWYPPRHRDHIAWGVSFDIVRDIRPLADVAGYNLKENFFEGAVDVNTYEGKTYWMSYISEPIVPVIAYNKSKVEEMGLKEPTDDWTFDELADFAKSGTTDDTFGYYRADRGGIFGGAPYFRQWGVEPTDEDGLTATFLDNAEGFVNALQFNYDLMNTWNVSPSPAAGAINAPELFGGQKVLAVDIWPFRIQIYPATFTDFEIDFALTPVVNKGDKRRSMLNEHVFGITTASENPDEAFTFLTWIAGKEMNVQALIQGQKGPIARADVWADERVYEEIPTYRKLRPIMEAIEPDFFVANFRGTEFDTAFSQVYDLVELGEESDMQAAAEEIQKLTQAVLDKEPA